MWQEGTWLFSDIIHCLKFHTISNPVPMYMNTKEREALEQEAYPNGGNCPRPGRTKMVSQSHVPSFKGRQLMTTSDQLEISEQALCCTASPDAANQDVKGLV